MLCLRDRFRVMLRMGVTLAVASAAFAPARLSAQALPQSINLSSAVGGGFNPVMTLDAKGGIDIAWIGAGVFFARSVDGGATFATTTVLPLSSPPDGVQMGVDTAGNIALLWPNPPDDTHPGGSAFFSRSTDGGTTFSAATEFAPASGVTSSSIQLAIEPSGAMDVVWLDLLRANLWAERSTDGGADFSVPVKVWATSGDVANLLAKRGADGQLYVFWTHISSATQCDVFFSRTVDAGVTFSAISNLSNTATSCSTNPRTSVDVAGGINVAWLVDNKSVWFSRSSNLGAAFTTPINVLGGVQFFTVSDQQVVVDSRGAVNLVWTGSLAESTVFLAHSENWGATFSSPKILSLPPQPNNPAVTGAGNPAIGEDSCGNILVAWSDDNSGSSSGDFDVFLDRSSDDAITFANPLNLSNTPADPEVVSQIAVDAHGNTNVLWTSVNFPQNVFYARVAGSSVAAGDFEMAVFPTQLSAPQGATERFVVAALSLGAPRESVTLGCFDLPVASTCTFNPPSVMTQLLFAPSQLTLTVSPALSPGAYVFAVSGVSATTSSTQTVELTVTSPGAMPGVRARAAGVLARQLSPTMTTGLRSSPAPPLASLLHSRSSFGERPEFVCRSGDERLCDALGGGVMRPRFPRPHRCRENAQPVSEDSRGHY
jgi:hypothetical protein